MSDFREEGLNSKAGPSPGGGLGGLQPPQFLADQLTLSQPGGVHYPHPVLQAPPDFQTLRRTWYSISKLQAEGKMEMDELNGKPFNVYSFLR